jgi:hypothetical protein
MSFQEFPTSLSRFKPRYFLEMQKKELVSSSESERIALECHTWIQTILMRSPSTSPKTKTTREPGPDGLELLPTVAISAGNARYG